VKNADTFYDLPGGRYFQSLVQNDVELYINIHETTCLLMYTDLAPVNSIEHMAKLVMWSGYSDDPVATGLMEVNSKEYSFMIFETE
jgi:hypothetical protein